MWTTSVRNTAVEKYSYSLVTEQGERDPDTLEDMIGKIETLAAPAYRKYLNQEPLSQDDRDAFAIFVSMMHLRARVMRRLAAEILAAQLRTIGYAYAADDAAWEQSMAEFEKKHGAVDDGFSERMRKLMLDPAGIKYSIAQEVTAPLALHQLKEIGQVINRMTWTRLSSDTVDFITSDSPVGLFLPSKFRGPHVGEGLAVPGIEVTLPLSPRLCWLGTWEKDAVEEMALSRANTKEMNRLRALHAERFLYSREHDSGIQKLAVKFWGMGTHLAPSGPGFDGKPMDVGQFNIQTTGFGKVDLEEDDNP